MDDAREAQLRLVRHSPAHSIWPGRQVERGGVAHRPGVMGGGVDVAWTHFETGDQGFLCIATLKDSGRGTSVKKYMPLMLFPSLIHPPGRLIGLAPWSNSRWN